MNSLNLNTAFYDEMFGSNEGAMNGLEIDALENARRMLTTPEKLSERIQPLPVILLQLIELLKDKKAEYAQLADLINQDPSLATRVLQIVNSPLYCAGTPINTMTTAVARLGISGVSSIASSVLMQKIRPPKPIYYKLFGRLIWTHSLHCAYFCQHFAHDLGQDRFSGQLLGLIHDVGKILIFECLTEALASNLEGAEPGSLVFKEAMSEMSLDTSYFIFREWGLPEEFCEAMQQQRTGAKSPLALALERGNACAEIYLLFNGNRIDAKMAEQMVGQYGCRLETWNDFLDSGRKIAELI